MVDEEGPASKNPRMEVDPKDVTEDVVLGWVVALQRLIKGKKRIDRRVSVGVLQHSLRNEITLLPRVSRTSAISSMSLIEGEIR
jgi:hypothetical protein